MKPEVEKKTTEDGVEEWILKGVSVHNSVGCEHYFVQKDAGRAECRECGLGLFGHCQGGRML